MTTESPVDSSAAGRPRDPTVDQRVLAAAAEVFGEDGWGKFTVDSVARRAGVGKASIYLRWPNKEALLVSAIEGRISTIADIDTGNIRDDLIQLAEQLLGSYFGESGPATIRLTMETNWVPEVAEHMAALRQSRVLSGRAIARRGIARGELPKGTSVTLLLDTICGACLNQALVATDHLRAKMEAKLPEYAAELVDFVLASATRGQK